MCPEGGTGALPRALPVDMDEPIPGKGTALVPQPVKAPVPSIKPALVPKPAGAPAPLKPMPVTPVAVKPVTPGAGEPVTPVATIPVTPATAGASPIGKDDGGGAGPDEPAAGGDGTKGSSFLRKPFVVAIIAVIIIAALGAGAFTAWEAGEDANEDPVAVISAPVGGTYHSTAGDIVLNGSESRDRDGGSITCSWSSDLEGFLGTGMAISTTLSKGMHIITLTVKDGEGGKDKALVSLTAMDPPEAVISPLAKEPALPELYDTEPVLLDGSNSTSPNGPIGDYDWVSDMDGPLGNGSQLEVSLKPGLHNVTLTVWDGYINGSTVAALEVMVNGMPEAVIDLPLNNGTYYAQNPITFNASSSTDPDGHELYFNWSSDGDGELGAGGVLLANLTEGAHIITLNASDGHGGFDMAELDMTVLPPNAPPLAVAGDDITGKVGALYVLNGSGSSDPEGQPLVYSWDMGEGTVLEGEEVLHIYMEGGEFDVTLTVSDGVKNATDSISVDVDGTMTEGAVMCGFVTHNVTDKPLEGAWVEVQVWGEGGGGNGSNGGNGGNGGDGGSGSGTSDPDGPEDGMDDFWFEWYENVTDRYGFYRIEYKPAEDGSIWASLDGFESYWKNMDLSKTGGKVVRKDIRLDPLPPRNSRVYGTVYDNETGETINDTWIDFYNIDTGDYNDTVSDQDGDYLVNLSAGEYWVFAWAESYWYYDGRVSVGEYEQVQLDIYLDKEPEPPPETSLIYGWVNDSDTDTPLEGIEVDIYNDDFWYSNYTTTDSDGYYEMNVPAGNFNVSCYVNDSSGKQYSDFYKSVEIGAEEEVLFNISLHEFRRSDFNLTVNLTSWNLLSVHYEAIDYENTGWMRYFMDTNDDGTVSAAEVEAYEAEMMLFIEINDTKDMFFVDDIYYDFVPGTLNYEIYGAEGPVESEEPITTELDAQFQSHTNIPIALTHTARVNATYDDEWADYTFYLVLPPGFSMSSSSSSANVNVSGGEEVLIEPGEDPDPEDDVYGEWVEVDAS